LRARHANIDPVTQDLRRWLAFVVVGTVAAGIHFAVVVLLVSQFLLAPLWANAVGWMVAFGASYTGHRWLTFRREGASTVRSLARFFVISAGGFLVNETAYALLLRHSGLGYRAALALILVAIAALTYLASRHWAFRSPD
jgi:putative flippase GtrA